VILDHIDPMCFLSLSHIGLHALILLPKPHHLGFGFSSFISYAYPCFNIVNQSLLVSTGHYLCKMYNCHDSRACGYKRSEILPRIQGIGLGVEWSSFGLAV
jgi:hypothetical protein